MLTSTPDGNSIGAFAMRDINDSLKYCAEHFAANSGFARFAISHQTFEVEMIATPDRLNFRQCLFTHNDANRGDLNVLFRG